MADPPAPISFTDAELRYLRALVTGEGGQGCRPVPAGGFTALDALALAAKLNGALSRAQAAVDRADGGSAP